MSSKSQSKSQSSNSESNESEEVKEEDEQNLGRLAINDSLADISIDQDMRDITQPNGVSEQIRKAKHLAKKLRKELARKENQKLKRH